ncbi:MAG: DNA repair protein RecN [Clostridiales bacterium]|nr:DNA repair protein RecN [Clostridiales bacterium]
MLLNLHVKNLAIIEELDVDFNDHLNIITGETGAGKSVILGSVNLALGGKVKKEMIRQGADYALVELLFEINDKQCADKIKEAGFELEDGQLLLSRKITAGKSVCRINGENVTQASLRMLGSFLIDIHSQHEHQSLFSKEKHLELLDQYAKEEIGTYLQEISRDVAEYQQIVNELSKGKMPKEERLRELSFLEYENQEIEEAAIKPGEGDALEREYRHLSNAESVRLSLGQAFGILSEGEQSVSELVGRAARIMAECKEPDERIKGMMEQLSDADSIIHDLNRDLSDYLCEEPLDQERLLEVEKRLDLIQRMAAKYGNEEEMARHQKENAEKILKLKNYEAYEQELLCKKEGLEKNLFKICSEVTRIRKKYAEELSAQITDTLYELNFSNVQFEIRFKELDHFTKNGRDEAEFYISTNPGEALAPIGKVASGGELSRVMLALKSVFAEHDQIPTLIFDEIDTGISGRTAQKVSEKLSLIAGSHQIICITHLPQIAAMADKHYVIKKRVEDDHTTTSITPLSDKETTEELARILGGARITDTVRDNAREMRQLAEQYKKSIKKTV